ncbi:MULTISPECIES: GNAT family N-acetyltransferase [unclassified Streptomyces]|uniref:GNAT family N-acetyltransferase n=1 Tax=unclassified Streptomyces TaxID=2593676 RepID=UPI002E10F545|nr:GNAT family N-acetyltransferase [Streptomyces sp. NBC_01197]WSS50127.1 GNAT family N-acetyltransferase [Streptomyces sp. NBC_01180]
MAVDVHTVSESEYRDWLRACHTGFLRPPVVSDEEARSRRPNIDLARTQGAFDRGRCVGTFRSFAQEITVVGGASLPSDAVTNVTVTPTHRRRGLLSRMMAVDLAAAKERGEALATLIAAEYPIYGRFGFGPAAWATDWTVDVPRAGLDPRWSRPECAPLRSASARDKDLCGGAGRIDLVDGADVRELGPELHARFRQSQPGATSRNERWWAVRTGLEQVPGHPWTEPFYAVYRSPRGEIDGLLVYTADDHWGDAKQPLNTADVTDLIAVSPAAERALWHFLCSVDWVTTVKAGHRGPDDLLPSLLPDPRAARITQQADFLWIRLLDVVRALEARTYEASGILVLEVRDHDGLSAGRYRLDASPDGAVCAPTSQAADVTLDVGELGALYLGDASAVRLAALGRISEETAGAVAVTEALFRTAVRPWCPDGF